MERAADRVHGTVDEWFEDEGWGRLRSPALDGLVFAHFSVISDQQGFRELQRGEAVTFTWEGLPQDGCRFSATDVRSDPERAVNQPDPEVAPPPAYRSSLTIRWEGDDQAPPAP